MFKIFYHAYWRRRELLRHQIPEHFLTIIIIASIIINVPAWILAGFFGLKIFGIIAPTLYMLLLGVLLLLTYTGKGRYDAKAAARAHRVWYRKRLRRRHRILRAVTDEFIDELYPLKTDRLP